MCAVSWLLPAENMQHVHWHFLLGFGEQAVLDTLLTQDVTLYQTTS